MRNRRILAGAFAAAALAVLPFASQASAATTAAGAETSSRTAASQYRPMDGPPGTVWTGKKFWTLSGCQAAGTELVASGKWADPFCDGTGVQYDLWARPL